MTLYELLRTLTRKAGLPEPAERDALALIDELERLNALGTMTTLTSVTDHEPTHGLYERVCSICHKEH
jgi:hypothetical protein